MTKNDADQFREIMNQVFLVYGKKPSIMLQRIWWKCFSATPLETFATAVERHISCPEKGQYLPKPADIISKITGTIDERKTHAASVFANILTMVNAYESYVFDDAAVHYAVFVAFGSWVNMCRYDDGEFKCQQQKRDFITAYASYTPQKSYPPRLIGILEQNEATGADTRYEINYIGNKQRAITVEKQATLGYER